MPGRRTGTFVPTTARRRRHFFPLSLSLSRPNWARDFERYLLSESNPRLSQSRIISRTETSHAATSPSYLPTRSSLRHLSLSLYPSSLRKKGVVNPDSGSSPALCAVGSRVRWPAQSFHRPLTVRSGGPLRPPAAGLDPGPARNGPVKARLGELFDSNSDSPPFCPYPAPPAVRWAGPHPLGGGRPIVRWRGRFGPYGAGRTN